MVFFVCVCVGFLCVCVCVCDLSDAQETLLDIVSQCTTLTNYIH